MRSNSSEDPTAPPDVIEVDGGYLVKVGKLRRDRAPELALMLYGAWLGASLAVWIWAERRRRRDLEHALEVLRARTPRPPEHYPPLGVVRQSEHDGADVPKHD